MRTAKTRGMQAPELVVERPGIQSLVVDRGRFGWLDAGVSWGGAADLFAFAFANRLVGNAVHAAAVEIAFGAASFRFTERTRFALTGAECDAALGGRPVPSWSACEAGADAVLALRAPRRGVRTVLAVRGGIDVPLVMGSRSTDLAAGIGGHEGRALRAGDRLRIGAATEAAFPSELRIAPPPWRENGATPIGVIAGGEAAWLPPDEFERFWSSQWRVSPRSSRMACVLEGDPLAATGMPQVRSHAVVSGVVQLPPSGLPIVLLCDAQTTGGYPKIGVIAEADLWKMAQLEPGARVRFQPMTLEQAAEATRRIEAFAGNVDRAIAERAAGV
jgi:biotin-dependent carboxylase-like uncharacterized protein